MAVAGSAENMEKEKRRVSAANVCTTTAAWDISLPVISQLRLKKPMTVTSKSLLKIILNFSNSPPAE